VRGSAQPVESWKWLPPQIWKGFSPFHHSKRCAPMLPIVDLQTFRCGDCFSLFDKELLWLRSYTARLGELFGWRVPTPRDSCHQIWATAVWRAALEVPGGAVEGEWSAERDLSPLIGTKRKCCMWCDLRVLSYPDIELVFLVMLRSYFICTIYIYTVYIYMLYDIISYYIILYHIKLYDNISYYIMLYHIVLYDIIF
jgi:hypothetical protein